MIKIKRNFSQIATLLGSYQKGGRNLLPEDLGLLENASVVFDEEKILWVGNDSDLPEEYEKNESTDFSGHVLLPEVVDSHTHLIFGGNRSQEYTMRLNGADYQEIAKAGGGILNTMTGTNSLSNDELLNLGRERIKRLHSYGIGTIEIKSGYGLNYDKEKEISLLIDQLKKEFSPKIQIKNTYMAAHAVPKNFKSSTEYMNEVVIPLLKELAPLEIIDAVDIFHERGYFELKDVTLLYEESRKLNIPFKTHADEFFDNKGAHFAAKNGALSTDHLLCTDIDGIKALAKSNTVANLLPGTGFFLGKPQANARAFLDAGVKVGIGSDYNPGSCHFDNVIMAASLAAPQYQMNIAELWTSITLNAANALGIKDQGAITPGLKPRFSIFKTPSIDEITYNWGRNLAVEL